MTSEYLLFRELEHVLAALTDGNRLVCEVCVATGLRVGDVCALPTAKLKEQFWITEAKTGKPRRVNLSRPLFLKLKGQAGETWVFEGARSPEKHRTRQAVWRDVKRASKAFRLPQNVTPHSLRKVFAVEQMKKTGDMKRVMRSLNHSDQSITMIYAMAYEIFKAKYKGRG